MVYKIGDFSKIVDVPVKTLRYYDEIDLFKPIEVDLFTGYRYYDENQIDNLMVILELKKIGFSLEEIKNNWGRFNNDIFLKKREELLNEISKYNENIRKLDNMRSKIVDGNIVLKEIKEENFIKVKKK